MSFRRIVFPFILVIGLLVSVVAAEPPAQKIELKKGDRLAIIGDSITEQKIYSRLMEDYLMACEPQLDLWVCQLGWGGETAAGFNDRFEVTLPPLKATVITTCYGMNDGRYKAFEDGIGKNYYDNMTKLVQQVRQAGTTAVVGSPGAVDSHSFKREVTPAVYNDNLDHLGALARSVATEQGQVFANVHDAMMTAMTAAKAKLGQEVPVCGGDGVHPGPNGHLVMAYAFLKGLGCDGNLATITIDMSGPAQVTDGHKILSAKDGKVEIESTRYPFCFPAEKGNTSERAILPFLPFNDDLNRFTLVVKNLQSDNAKVTWGEVSKTFTRGQLTKGVNLAAEFLDNPFLESFNKVDAAVAAKQAFETDWLKNQIRALASWSKMFADDAEAASAVKVLSTRLVAKHESLRAAVVAACAPVKHTVTVTPQ